MASCKGHWESIYASKGDEQLSWTQAEPLTSLSLIGAVCPSGRVIDVGGGTSILAKRLLERGYSVTVLDISEKAIRRARERFGAKENDVNWIIGDLTTDLNIGTFDVWHDRAVFHFLTDPTKRAAYKKLLLRTILPGGHVVIEAFALDGPKECSGLEVRRYDAPMLAVELGPEFDLLRYLPKIHVTPWGKPQSFLYAVLRRSEL